MIQQKHHGFSEKVGQDIPWAPWQVKAINDPFMARGPGGLSHGLFCPLVNVYQKTMENPPISCRRVNLNDFWCIFNRQTVKLPEGTWQILFIMGLL